MSPSNSCRKHLVALSTMASLVLLGCVTRPIVDPRLTGAKQDVKSFPQSLEKDVDLLFLVDDSRSMLGEQISLATNFSKLIDALRSDKLGPVDPTDAEATCTAADPSGCKIPDVHIGVVSPNLGAGDLTFVETCEVRGGLQGKLQNQAREPGCTPPDDAWISYEGDGNKTNIRSSETDPIKQVSDAFKCIAQLGADGCGFEQQLEATKRALDPQLNVNPGFLRKDALLAVVFITDEDDCSAADPRIYDIRDYSTFGPSNWRCFEFGVTCAGTTPDNVRQPGSREGCVPSQNWLKPVTDAQAGASGQSYEAFFKSLKTRNDGRPRAGRVIMSAIAGPPTPVGVRSKDGVGPAGEAGPDLVPSCEFGTDRDDRTEAFPGIRIASLISAFDAADDEVPGTFTKICPESASDDNFGRALTEIGNVIRTALGRQCITSPLFRRGGGLACAANEDLGQGHKCPSPGCLAEVDCQVEEGTDDAKPVSVERCPVDLFDNLAADSCSGDLCPCWRIVPSDSCSAETDGSPYALDILRPPNTEIPPATFADVACNASSNPWGSAALFTTLDEDEDGTPERICQ